jgi:hypothetical protein
VILPDLPDLPPELPIYVGVLTKAIELGVNLWRGRRKKKDKSSAAPLPPPPPASDSADPKQEPDDGAT